MKQFVSALAVCALSVVAVPAFADTASSSGLYGYYGIKQTYPTQAPKPVQSAPVRAGAGVLQGTSGAAVYAGPTGYLQAPVPQGAAGGAALPPARISLAPPVATSASGRTAPSVYAAPVLQAPKTATFTGASPLPPRDTTPYEDQRHIAPAFTTRVEGYYYDYQEPDYDVDMVGPFLSFDISYTFRDADLFGGAFVTLDANNGVGVMDYSSPSSGSNGGELNYKGDYRVLAGWDMWVNDAIDIAPYTGFGYRMLFDEGRGTVTTTGAVGYNRLSKYAYLPVGVNMGFRSGNWTWRPSFEYDFLLTGYQRSGFKDLGYDHDVINKQTKGYGIRGALMAETKTGFGLMSFGPFVRYWNIDDSERENVQRGGTVIGSAIEPKNETVETGVAFQLGY
jgi:hypothetical protein